MPAPSKNLLSSDNSKNYKIKTKDNDQLNASNHSSSIRSIDIGIYESIEQLNKSTGCFPLDRHKTKKSNTNTNTAKELDTNNLTRDAICIASSELHEIDRSQCIETKSHRNHFDRLVERFQRKRIQQNLGVKRTQRNNTIEQKAFYHWLHLNRNKRLERNVKCLDDADVATTIDRQQTLCTPVIRKRSTKSNSIRKLTKKSTKPSSSSSTSRFSSCIPYCVTAIASRNGSFADNSLASNHRYTEHCRKQSGASISSEHQPHRLQTSNDCLMHSHCKSNKHFSPSNKNTDNNHNNNCSLFNNLNIMDRSVDSIGSCSLDVDAESTDFSGITFKVKTKDTKIETRTHFIIFFARIFRKKKKFVRFHVSIIDALLNVCTFVVFVVPFCFFFYFCFVQFLCRSTFNLCVIDLFFVAVKANLKFYFEKILSDLLKPEISAT